MVISKTSTPMCQNGGQIIFDGLWVVRPAFVEGRPQQMIVCMACDRRTPQNDLEWYNRSHRSEERSC